MKVTNVLMAGVGGQGIILASGVLAQAAAAAGFKVKKSDVHGMAQRGGSVSSHVRFGEVVYSPLIPEGETDILMASEFLEGLRMLPHLRSGGRVVLSTQRILPPTVSRGEQAYPEDILRRVQERDPRAIHLDCLELAREAGDARTATVVLLGALSTLLPFPEINWLQLLEEAVPKKAVKVNLVAFQRGRELAKNLDREAWP
jgi:indolepyruvate ferredoxin oxidoreductase beta subunit